MSKKHQGRFKGDPVTYQLPSPAGGVQGNLCAAGIPVRGPPRAGGTLGRAGHCVDAGSWTGIPLQRLLDEQRAASVADIAEAEGMDVTGTPRHAADPIGPGVHRAVGGCARRRAGAGHAPPLAQRLGPADASHGTRKQSLTYWSRPEALCRLGGRALRGRRQLIPQLPRQPYSSRPRSEYLYLWLATWMVKRHDLY